MKKLKKKKPVKKVGSVNRKVLREEFKRSQKMPTQMGIGTVGVA